VVNRWLTLMRHAEAQVATVGGDDFTRPLTSAGRIAAANAAQQLGAAPPPPALIWHSPALRTTETAALVAARLSLPASRVLAMPAVYLASGSALLALLAPAEPRAHLLLIGHNPGVSELLQLLDADAARTRRWLATAETVTLPP
jgi:phosphohistidine phosphatase